MKLKSFFSKKGFTLVEVVIGITVLGVIGLVMSEILSRTFRGGDKAQLVTNIKQNGQSALSTMDQTIRYSQLICPTNGTPSRVITVLRDNKLVRFRIALWTSGSNNGAILQENPPLSTISTAPASLCDETVSFPPSQNLINTSSTNANGISVRSGSFTNVAQLAGKGTIQVNFDLGVSFNAGTGAHETLGATGVVPFQTTIQLR